MYRAKKPLLIDLNEHLICKLCKGYFVDATTIIECLHTFCRNCIVKYLETTKYCPICDVQVHKSKPLLRLRPDKILQDVVYKLVPRLYQNELRRRKEFQKKHPDIKLSSSEESFEASQGLFLSPEEELCVTLTYYGSLGKPRYLRCPSAVSVMVLQKLIRAKFGLSDSHHVDILHNQDCLSPRYTLMDIMYIYKLSKLEPLDLTYRIYEFMAKKLKLEHQESKLESDISQQQTSNNNNWKEVQLRISENGEMSITGIQDDITSQNFSKEMIEVLDSKPKSPVLTCTKKTEVTDVKIVKKPTSKCINIISDTIIRQETKKNYLLPEVGNKGICNVTSSVTVTSMPPPAVTTVNLTDSVVVDAKKEEIIAENPVGNLSVDLNNQKMNNGTEEQVTKGVKRKFEDLNSETKTTTPKKIVSEDSVETKNDQEKISEDKPKTDQNNSVPDKIKSVEPEKKVQIDVTENDIKSSKSQEHPPTSNGNGNFKHKEETEKNLTIMNSIPPKPSTKYQGNSQPCYMPKTSVLNVPKIHQSNVTMRSDTKTSSKTISNVKNEVKVNSSSSSPAGTPSNASAITKQKLNTKVKSNAPMGYKTLKDPPKSWNSQISKANLNKAQPDPKYTDLKNVRPAKFFKMRNTNMLRFLGNPASGVKPMYSVHVNSDQDKSQEKVSDAKETKKQSIVKIDPKTLKPITEKVPEIPNSSNPASTGGDLKINTSSVSIFNPLKLQSSSPKSERKSPKSPQSPRHKSSPSPSPPVPKRDKPNLNFTPPNPFVPNLSSQTVNPNQFLCNAPPPGFPSYDPRVMAAYHNLFYGAGMGFPPSPLSYHLGGMDMGGQRGKGFDISKIVGMQQQQQQQASSSKSPSSPQSTSKLDVPIVPPQVPYQPRPSPMSGRTSSMTPPAKRHNKDQGKNEKSLQNTVEKLALNRAKEINRAAEALTKLTASDLTKIENNRNNNRTENRKDEDKGRGVQSGFVKRPKHPPNETKTSQEGSRPEIRDKSTNQSTKYKNTSEKDSKSETSATESASRSQVEPNCSGTNNKRSRTDENDKSCETKTKTTDDIDRVRDSDSGKSGKSGVDSKNVNEAGSENVDGLAGNK